MENKSDITLEDNEVVIDGNFAIHALEDDVRRLNFNTETSKFEICSPDKESKLTATVLNNTVGLDVGSGKSNGTVRIDGGSGQAGILLRGTQGEISTWNEKGKIYDLNTKDGYVRFANNSQTTIFDLDTNKPNLKLSGLEGKNAIELNGQANTIRVKDDKEGESIYMNGNSGMVRLGSTVKPADLEMYGPGKVLIKMSTNNKNGALTILEDIFDKENGHGLTYSTGNGKLMVMKGEITITQQGEGSIDVFKTIRELQEEVANLRRDLDNR